MPPHRNAYRPVVMGTRGVVTSAHPLASMAGIQMLLAGGNAVDAAVATVAMLAVVEPTGTGPGGDCFALVYRATSRDVLALNGSGRSPTAMSAGDLRALGYKTMPNRGALTITVPGAVDAWACLLAAEGRLSLAEVLAPAIRTAGLGFPVSERIAAACFAFRAGWICQYRAVAAS